MLSYIICSKCWEKYEEQHVFDETEREYRKYPDLHDKKYFTNEVERCFEYYMQERVKKWFDKGVCGCGDRFRHFDVSINDKPPESCAFILEHAMMENMICAFEICNRLDLHLDIIKQRLGKNRCVALGKIGQIEYWDKSVLEKIK